eukprot:TRINITY_DN36947_c0_g1_i3.p1 TRINITY_DN36947_c0_g1~~TRINITY_DN36947_c0_g1_i3.p1  ORF type:complete len:296 (-),score=38.94 TRINITY_DN36947_c0_g1_i3:881-1768(-)
MRLEWNAGGVSIRFGLICVLTQAIDIPIVFDGADLPGDSAEGLFPARLAGLPEPWPPYQERTVPETVRSTMQRPGSLSPPETRAGKPSSKFLHGTLPKGANGATGAKGAKGAKDAKAAKGVKGNATNATSVEALKKLKQLEALKKKLAAGKALKKALTVPRGNIIADCVFDGVSTAGALARVGLSIAGAETNCPAARNGLTVQDQIILANDSNAIGAIDALLPKICAIDVLSAITSLGLFTTLVSKMFSNCGTTVNMQATCATVVAGLVTALVGLADSIAAIEVTCMPILRTVED